MIAELRGLGLRSLEFRVWGVRFRALGFRGLGLRSFGFRAWSVRFRVYNRV